MQSANHRAAPADKSNIALAVAQVPVTGVLDLLNVLEWIADGFDDRALAHYSFPMQVVEFLDTILFFEIKNFLFVEK